MHCSYASLHAIPWLSIQQPSLQTESEHGWKSSWLKFNLKNFQTFFSHRAVSVTKWLTLFTDTLSIYLPAALHCILAYNGCNKSFSLFSPLTLAVKNNSSRTVTSRDLQSFTSTWATVTRINVMTNKCAPLNRTFGDKDEVWFCCKHV